MPPASSFSQNSKLAISSCFGSITCAFCFIWNPHYSLVLGVTNANSDSLCEIHFYVAHAPPQFKCKGFLHVAVGVEPHPQWNTNRLGLCNRNSACIYPRLNFGSTTLYFMTNWSHCIIFRQFELHGWHML